MHRDLNRGDQRMLWNALLNWQAIVRGTPGVQDGRRRAKATDAALTSVAA